MNAQSSILASVLVFLSTACSASPELEECRRDEFVVAIDIGHSAENPGSRSARGVDEYTFNREMATLLNDALHAAGFTQATLIEHEPSAPSFAERSVIASERHASLLLSIHHDSVQPHYLETWTFGGETLDYSDAFHGYSVFASRRNSRAAKSERFGRLLGLSMLRHGFTPTLHHAEPIKGENRELMDESSGVYFFDDLLILHTPAVPAVLLECGVIKNRHEELFLRDPAFRKRMIDAIVFAVDGYCSTERYTPLPTRMNGAQ